MRRLADAQRIHELLERLGQEARSPLRLFLTGGATAVLLGWRQTTIDVDIKLVPEDDRLLRAISALKDTLEINIELACPADFVPVPAGWEDRGRFIAQLGNLGIYHFEFEAQALAKIERGHRQDRDDVKEMLQRGLVKADGLRALFVAIEPDLYRFPALDPRSYRRALEEALAGER
ncbi:MAG: hypothetical protein HYX75_16025 [Acidobacteria bacterium]|nr:hypothetical protein [Acidobacteriota bacterium]